MRLRAIRLCFMALAMGCGSAALAQDVPAGTRSITLSPAELFDYAENARKVGDFAAAEQALRALAGNPDPDLRNEARFRLGMMLGDQLKRPRDAAVEFRKILDEKPDAARVRLELARMQAQMGHLGAAERELRAAQAGGLPPEVQKLVRFYAGALAANKPFGFSMEAALAPDTNINRATRSDTLGTIIGDFALNGDAQAKSGLGLALKGQTYWRLPAGERTRLLVQLDGYANFYRASRFDDTILAVQAGPEYALGQGRLSVAATASWRWFGLKPYSRSLGGSAVWQHPLGKRSQIRAEAALASVSNRLNPLQSGDSFRAALGVDRAFSPRFGGGFRIEGSRDTAADPGYAMAGGGANFYLFREAGKTTFVLGGGYNRLEADQRLFIYPRRRMDNRFTLHAGATLRALRVGPFAPLLRARWERNVSTIEVYDYNRLAGEIGITAAF